MRTEQGRQIFRLENYTFQYPEASQPALRGIDLTLYEGEFVCLCGESGSGKTTLLRQLKPSLAPHGQRSGAIFYLDEALVKLSRARECGEIGFVGQHPENQLVTERVWQELAFGLENLGMEPAEMRLRVGELASFFGLGPLFQQPVDQLSGGQKQLLNLAAVLVMQPRVLLLDEPTSRLDPLAASDFLQMLERLNRELGITIFISEQRLEDVLPLADRLVVLEQGRVFCEAPPKQAAAELCRQGRPLLAALPAATRIAHLSQANGEGEPLPLSVREGRAWLAAHAQDGAVISQPKPSVSHPPVLEARSLCFRYQKQGPDILHDFNYVVQQGKINCLLGANGAGKSTALAVLAGILRPLRGRVQKADQRLALLPQNPQSLFLAKTVAQELAAGSEESRQKAIAFCRLETLLASHPYDLSGGEQQRLALAKLLLLDPQILLLDEPTKGLDAAFKKRLGQLLRQLCAEGKTILLASHDIEFCAAYADACALLFDGSCSASAAPRAFFSQHFFYTTAANRIARAYCPQAILCEEVAQLCR